MNFQRLLNYVSKCGQLVVAMFAVVLTSNAHAASQTFDEKTQLEIYMAVSRISGVASSFNEIDNGLFFTIEGIYLYPNGNGTGKPSCSFINEAQMNQVMERSPCESLVATFLRAGIPVTSSGDLDIRGILWCQSYVENGKIKYSCGIDN